MRDDGLDAARGIINAFPLALAAWSVIAFFGVWYAYPEAVAGMFDGVIRLAVAGS